MNMRSIDPFSRATCDYRLATVTNEISTNDMYWRQLIENTLLTYSRKCDVCGPNVRSTHSHLAHEETSWWNLGWMWIKWIISSILQFASIFVRFENFTKIYLRHWSVMCWNPLASEQHCVQLRTPHTLTHTHTRTLCRSVAIKLIMLSDIESKSF